MKAQVSSQDATLIAFALIENIRHAERKQTINPSAENRASLLEFRNKLRAHLRREWKIAEKMPESARFVAA